MNNIHILLVEDDNSIANFIRSYLLEQGIATDIANKGLEALEKIDSGIYELVLLDWMLPDISGLEVCRKIKKNNPDLPIIMLTAKTNIKDKVEGFSTGADDYLTKPFEPEELLYRIKARLKNNIKENILYYGELSINTVQYKVFYKKEEIELSPQEYKLLVYLAENANMVLSRERILDKVWGFNLDVETRVVDVYIGYLRKKIDEQHKTNFICSKRGFGYYFSFESK